jgi:hypothetical protein
MKSHILLLAVIVTALSSCSTAYKTGQTPDDVYFSPGRPHDEYVQVEKKEDYSYRGEEYYEARYLKMRVQNRYRWSALDDYYYFNNPYAYNYYSYYSNWNNPWNSYWAWNNYYNPYCHYGGVIIIKNPAAYKPPPAKPLAFNASSYLGNTTNTTQQSGRVKNNGAYYNNSYNSGSTRYNNSNSNSGSRNSNNYSNSNSRSSNNYTPSGSTPTRSYTPSSSSSSSSRSSSGSSNSSSGSSRPKR